MRQRIKTTSVCRATPEGKKRINVLERLNMKFQNGTITRDELRILVNLNGRYREPSFVMVKILGTLKKVAYKEYKEQYEPRGFVCI